MISQNPRQEKRAAWWDMCAGIADRAFGSYAPINNTDQSADSFRAITGQKRYGNNYPLDGSNPSALLRHFTDNPPLPGEKEPE